MKKIVISSSVLKALFVHGNEREDICWRKFHAKYITKEVKFAPSEVQLYGLYFESQALGSSAGGETYDDLPRKNNGDKRSIQVRLDEQLVNLRAGQVENYINIVPGINTQVSIYKRWLDSKDIFLRATYDIFPTTMLYKNQILPVVSVDLKTTKDVEGDWGEYCWGTPENMDHTQLVMQNFMVKDFDVELNRKANPLLFEKGIIKDEVIHHFDDLPVFYWIFETGLKKRNKILKVSVDNTRTAELQEVIRKAISIIMDNETIHGWEPLPKYENCKNCPLSYKVGGTCKEVEDIKEV